MGRNGPWIGGRLEDRPSAILRRHVWVSPFPEDDPVPIAKAVGDDRLVFGSDFPHAEGLAEPASYAERLGAFSPDVARKILRQNARALLGLGV
jgi:predicted TIM-barrel fold metal-dependent hydrolase